MRRDTLTDLRHHARDQMSGMMTRLRHGLGITAIGVVWGIIVAYAALASFGAVDMLLSLWPPSLEAAAIGWTSTLPSINATWTMPSRFRDISNRVPVAVTVPPPAWTMNDLPS